MALIYVADKERDAKIKVHEDEKEIHADLLVYHEENYHHAKGDALWCFVDKERDADVSIFFVDKSNHADLIICYVDRPNHAKWRKDHKLINRLTAED